MKGPENHSSELLPGAKAIVENAAVVKPGEHVVILADTQSKPVAEHFVNSASAVTDSVDMLVIPLATGHGESPAIDSPEKVIRADVVLACTTFSLSHTQLRVDICRNGGRFLSLADYDLNMLHGGGTLADYAGMVPLVQHVAKLLDSGNTLRLTTDAGTHITMSIEGRTANAAAAYCPAPGDFGSPPDIEANIAPVEDLTEGLLVIDGSVPVPHIGLIKEPIYVEIKQGQATRLSSGKQAETLQRIWNNYGHSSVRVAAELGIGLNPQAKLCGRMLEDEGVFGTAHIGFGANNTIGGTNFAPVHIDAVCLAAKVIVDGKPIVLPIAKGCA